MRSQVSFTLYLLAATRSVLSAPVVSSEALAPLDTCTENVSCRSAYLVPNTADFDVLRSAAQSPPTTILSLSPHFQAHNLIVQSNSAQHPVLPAPPANAARLELITTDLADARTRHANVESPPRPILSTANDESSALFATVVSKFHTSIAGARSKCHSGRLTTLFRHEVEEVLPDEQWSSRTYTQTFTSIRGNYTDLLVIGVVLVFLLAVVLIEMLDCMAELTRATLSLPGSIRLRDEERLPAYVLVEDTPDVTAKCICNALKSDVVKEKA